MANGYSIHMSITPCPNNCKIEKFSQIYLREIRSILNISSFSSFPPIIILIVSHTIFMHFNENCCMVQCKSSYMLSDVDNSDCRFSLYVFCCCSYIWIGFKCTWLKKYILDRKLPHLLVFCTSWSNPKAVMLTIISLRFSVLLIMRNFFQVWLLKT